MFSLTRTLTSRTSARSASTLTQSSCGGLLLASTSSSVIAGGIYSNSSSSTAASTILQCQRFCAAVPASTSSSGSGSELATSNMNLAPEPTQTSQSGTARATDVAKRVNATKRAHQTATPDERKRLERSAWADLNSLSEEEIASADGQATAIILNAWGYFAKFWERGKEGPLN